MTFWKISLEPNEPKRRGVVHGVDLFNIVNLRGLLNGRQENLLIDRIKSETKN